MTGRGRAEGFVDLNADVGEECGDDLALLGIVTSANIATGAHAGGGAVLADVTRAAVERGVAVGAHPSYRDREGFGRASLLGGLRADPAARDAFVADLSHQILAVAAAADAAGGRLAHVKAHGSLYNEAVADVFAAALVLDAVRQAAEKARRVLPIVTQPGGALATLAGSSGWPVIREGFVDRAYDRAGRLVPRSSPDAVHHEQATMVAQALDLARGEVRTHDGVVLPMSVESLCVHGDTPGAVAAAHAVRDALEEAGWTVAAPDAGLSHPTASVESAGPGEPAGWRQGLWLRDARPEGSS